MIEITSESGSSVVILKFCIFAFQLRKLEKSDIECNHFFKMILL